MTYDLEGHPNQVLLTTAPGPELADWLDNDFSSVVL